jgi:hypothetical protein
LPVTLPSGFYKDFPFVEVEKMREKRANRVASKIRMSVEAI